MTVFSAPSTLTLSGGGFSPSSPLLPPLPLGPACSIPRWRPLLPVPLPTARPGSTALWAALAGRNDQLNNGGDVHGKKEKERGEERRRVQCEVEVVSWRERRIRARVLVAADVDSVWGVLTDYERLADFIPNLVHSRTIPCPHEGRVWLEQRGLQRALYWHIEARVLLDLHELPDLANGRELHFFMVDGDFKKFEGKWAVKAGPRFSTTTLSYEVNVIPRFNFPAIFIERIIRSDLPVNLQALAWRAERNYEGNQNKPLSGRTYSSSDVSQMNGLFSNESKEKDFVSSFNNLVTSLSSQYTSNWGTLGKICSVNRPCLVDEVHLRRFDGLLVTH